MRLFNFCFLRMRWNDPNCIFFPLQVKIWFQNKRSKFKKLMKQGGSTIDTNVLATGRGLSSGSPSVAPVWTSPSTVKTSVGTAGSYIPSYTSWYPTTHQESMQQSQLMWTGAFSADISGEVVKWWKAPHLQPLSAAQQRRCADDAPPPPPHPAKWHRGHRGAESGASSEPRGHKMRGRGI